MHITLDEELAYLRYTVQRLREQAEYERMRAA
jgi:hypothetical protein